MKYLITLLVIVAAFPLCAQTALVEGVNGASIGDSIVQFSAMDQDSNHYQLTDDLIKGNVVVVFIRGQWCPYCNRHLSFLQDSIDLINKTGAKLVVVSPENPEFIEKSIKKTGAEFTLLYDSGYIIMKQFDVLFTPDDKTLTKYKRIFSNALIESHSDDSQRLPVPATFILDQEGVIKWRHFDTDYKNRSTVSEILENL